jgi:hypothetical protein
VRLICLIQRLQASDLELVRLVAPAEELDLPPVDRGHVPHDPGIVAVLSAELDPQGEVPVGMT